MPKTYYDSELTGAQIESALEAIDGVVTPSNNGKILRVKDGNIEAVSASEYTSGIDVESLSATANGTYTAPAGKAYSPVTVNVSGGSGGGNLPSGGTDGDVLVKNGATDYDATWTNTPKLLNNIATINPTSAARTTYYVGDLLVYDGKLYVVTAQTISEGTTLIPGDGGNIAETSVAAQLSRPWQRLINDVTTANTSYDKTHTVYYPNNATEVLCTLQLNSNGRTIATAYLPLGQISGAAVYVGGSYTVGVGAPSDYVNAVFIHTSPTSIEISVPATPVALKVRFFAR